MEVLSLSNPAPVQIYKVLPINGKNYEHKPKWVGATRIVLNRRQWGGKAPGTCKT